VDLQHTATMNRDRIVGIPEQRLGKQLLSLQQMLTKVIPVTTTCITEENLPFDKVSPTRYVRNLFQGGGHLSQSELLIVSHLISE
jgi:hypothetical protein